MLLKTLVAHQVFAGIQVVSEVAADGRECATANATGNATRLICSSRGGEVLRLRFTEAQSGEPLQVHSGRTPVALRVGPLAAPCDSAAEEVSSVTCELAPGARSADLLLRHACFGAIARAPCHLYHVWARQRRFAP